MSHPESQESPDCLCCRALDTLDDPTLIMDGQGRIVFWNRAAAQFYGVTAEAAVGQNAADLVAREGEILARRAEAAIELRAGREWRTELRQTRADGSPVTARATFRPITDVDGNLHVVMTMVDITSDRAMEEQRDLLAAAVDQASESVVITDLDANILYVNPAFEEVTGYRRDEVLGRNPRVLKSGRQSSRFYRGMWDRLLAGEVFRTEFENRRKDGSIYREIATISPVRGPDGNTKHYVAVKRDVTRQRAFERQIDREARERATTMGAMATLRPGATAEETAASITAALVERCGFTEATILSFEADDQAITLAALGPFAEVDLLPRVISRATSIGLVQRANTGPWIENSGAHFAAHRRQVEVGALAHVPIVSGDQVLGLLIAGAALADADGMPGRLDLLVELAALAGALLGPALEQRRASAASRQRIQAVLDGRAFRPVFQPIVDLVSGSTVGHEALTRFDDGTPPDVVFATAQRCGIGLELEERTMAAALDAADSLPANGMLHVNVSPAMVLDQVRLRELLSRWGWKVIVEVTEHDPIDDYEAIRTALAAIGPGVELAVDDAGAGFASLRHILELRPRIVKLDRSLVAELDRDLTRQALVAGMVHFAITTGFDLVAEGVETEAERRTLVALGVRLGQGWLLGRPAAAPLPPATTIAVVSRPTGARSRPGLEARSLDGRPPGRLLVQD